MYNIAMDLRAHITKDTLSHAYIIEGARDAVLPALRTLLLSFDIQTEANPDYHEYLHEAFLREHALSLRSEQSFYGADGAKKIFVVAFNTITHESQNLLLKTLEEPTRDTHIFFVVRTGQILLPTVRSRMQLIRAESNDADASDTVDAQKFLGSSIALRMKLIESITKVKADDKQKAKEEARVLVESLEPVLYKRFVDGEVGLHSALEDILYAKRELAGRAPSVKLLLEHLALTLPK